MKRLTLLLAALSLAAAACGGDDDDTSAGAGGGDERTIEITMDDIEFDPASIEVTTGETIRFVFENKGEVDHDAFIGDAEAQADHEDEMSEMEGMDHGGGDEGITVEPGETGELTYTFEESASVEIGCHQPGHYEAGMKVDVTVS